MTVLGKRVVSFIIVLVALVTTFLPMFSFADIPIGPYPNSCKIYAVLGDDANSSYNNTFVEVTGNKVYIPARNDLTNVAYLRLYFDFGNISSLASGFECSFSVLNTNATLRGINYITMYGANFSGSPVGVQSYYTRETVDGVVNAVYNGTPLGNTNAYFSCYIQFGFIESVFGGCTLDFTTLVWGGKQFVIDNADASTQYEKIMAGDISAIKDVLTETYEDLVEFDPSSAVSQYISDVNDSVTSDLNNFNDFLTDYSIRHNSELVFMPVLLTLSSSGSELIRILIISIVGFSLAGILVMIRRIHI